MTCKYFGLCASCTLYDKNYDEQLNYKIQREKNRFSNLTALDFDIIKSTPKNFRNRAEFRVWWEKDEQNNKDILTYAMNDFNKEILKIDKTHTLVGYLCVGYVSEFLETPELETLGWETKKKLEDVVQWV